MIAKARLLFSSIGVKLFLCFWLIAIVSIFATRFISAQLIDNGLILPAHHGDVRQLHAIARQISRDQPLNLIPYLNDFQLKQRHRKKIKNKQTARIPPNIWLKDTELSQLFSKNISHKADLPEYLLNNSFSDLVSIQFSYARVTGPLTVLIKDKNYQLYIAHKYNDRHFGKLLMQLPPWVRISIPLMISFLLCWLLARNLSRPLSQMKKVATELGDGDLSARLVHITERNDELGSLAKTLNQMAEKLSVSLSAQQRLIGDVSHELRSPMTRLQLALALAQKSSDEPQQLSDYLQRCETEVQRLDEMIADVLALSRLENALHTLHFEQINLAGLLAILLQDAQFLANAKSIKIKTSGLADFPIRADSQLLSSAIANILSNAVKYSPQNGEILLTTAQQKDQLCLSFSDSGQGVPEQSLPLLFEPFYRVTQARERQTGGTGLGLAIAKQSILAHQGQIYAQNNPEGGLTVIIKVPLNRQKN
jgi:two-component system sensor histidine kinase CpxA